MRASLRQIYAPDASFELNSIFTIMAFSFLGTSGILLLALQIAAVYAIVRLLTYRNDKKEAQKINERLKAFKRELLKLYTNRS
ncbi:putative membrane protein [Fontibacillus solani]|uniref:Putative membrane protein n=1 Tax=Fontibacillus solani TaxID=1572857 RepID=A0A7W3SRX3_9BACL|nr:hypothetical protein [Fontibacillus solani]MBA9084959.1 putative membrane protein [Fontibacillus solani]